MARAIAVGLAVVALLVGAGARAQTVTDPFWVLGPAPRVGIARATPWSTSTVAGQVTAVGPRRRAVEVFEYDSNEPYRIEVGPRTHVVGPRGERLGREQIAPGAQVRADFGLRQGRMVANEVEVLARPQPPAR